MAKPGPDPAPRRVTYIEEIAVDHEPGADDVLLVIEPGQPHEATYLLDGQLAEGLLEGLLHWRNERAGRVN